MIQIRQGTFETNSSSVHELVIPKDCELCIPAKVYLTGGEYGWGPETTDDTINYMYQACLDRGPEEVNKFVLYLMEKGIEIDYHGYEIPLEHLFKSRRLLDRFLFGVGSYVLISNDNRDDVPDPSDFDLTKYDVIEKGN